MGLGKQLILSIFDPNYSLELTSKYFIISLDFLFSLSKTEDTSAVLSLFGVNSGRDDVYDGPHKFLLILLIFLDYNLPCFPPIA